MRPASKQQTKTNMASKTGHQIDMPVAKPDNLSLIPGPTYVHSSSGSRRTFDLWESVLSFPYLGLQRTILLTQNRCNLKKIHRIQNQESRLFGDNISINRPCCDTVPSHHPVGKCLTPPLTMQCHRPCAKSTPLPSAQFSSSQWVNPSCNAQRSKSQTVTPNPKLQLLSWAVIPSSELQQYTEHWNAAELIPQRPRPTLGMPWWAPVYHTALRFYGIIIVHNLHI